MGIWSIFTYICVKQDTYMYLGKFVGENLCFICVWQIEIKTRLFIYHTLHSMTFHNPHLNTKSVVMSLEQEKASHEIYLFFVTTGDTNPSPTIPEGCHIVARHLMYFWLMKSADFICSFPSTNSHEIHGFQHENLQISSKFVDFTEIQQGNIKTKYHLPRTVSLYFYFLTSL